MEWFYRHNGQEIGPVSAGDLKALFKSGSIGAATQVRRQDMSAWQPLQQFVRGAPSPDPGAEASTAPANEAAPSGWTMPSPIPTDGSTAATCSECGRAAAAADLIRFDDAIICSDCKPLFIQKLRAGVNVRSGPVYAGFWVRFGAKLIDLLILVGINLVTGLIFILAAGGMDGGGASPADSFLLQAIYQAFGAGYTTLFLGRFGATPGKMACGLRVVAADGRSISYLRALGRYLAEFLSGMLLMLGYIMAAFDGEKRTLHDRVCATRVVRV